MSFTFNGTPIYVCIVASVDANGSFSGAQRMLEIYPQTLKSSNTQYGYKLTSSSNVYFSTSNYAKINGKTVSWYTSQTGTTAPAYQMNYIDITYYWFAITL